MEHHRFAVVPPPNPAISAKCRVCTVHCHQRAFWILERTETRQMLGVLWLLLLLDSLGFCFVSSFKLPPFKAGRKRVEICREVCASWCHLIGSRRRLMTRRAIAARSARGSQRRLLDGGSDQNAVTVTHTRKYKYSGRSGSLTPK